MNDQELTWISDERILTFWGWVSIKSDKVACWEWSGKPNNMNYGRFSVDNYQHYAHRVAYCLSNNVDMDAIDGLVIRHTCDNSICCNPHHLIAGTQHDNLKDKQMRFTGSHGTSKYKGVSWCNKAKKWKAQIQIDGKNNSLGLYDDELDAAGAVKKKLVSIYGTAQVIYPHIAYLASKGEDLNQ